MVRSTPNMNLSTSKMQSQDFLYRNAPVLQFPNQIPAYPTGIALVPPFPYFCVNPYNVPIPSCFVSPDLSCPSPYVDPSCPGTYAYTPQFVFQQAVGTVVNPVSSLPMATVAMEANAGIGPALQFSPSNSKRSRVADDVEVKRRASA